MHRIPGFLQFFIIHVINQTRSEPSGKVEGGVIQSFASFSVFCFVLFYLFFHVARTKNQGEHMASDGEFARECRVEGAPARPCVRRYSRVM